MDSNNEITHRNFWSTSNGNVNQDDIKSMMDFLIKKGGGEAELKNDGKLHLVVTQAEYDYWREKTDDNLGFSKNRVRVIISHSFTD